MTGEKKPPVSVAGNQANDSCYRWAVQHDPDGDVALKVFRGLSTVVVEMTADEALLMAYTLLTNACDDFDLAAATQRLSALALACQVVTHRHDDLRPCELAVGDDDVGDVSGLILYDVGDRG